MNKPIPLFILPYTLTLYALGIFCCGSHHIPQRQNNLEPTAHIGFVLSIIDFPGDIKHSANDNNKVTANTTAYSEEPDKNYDTAETSKKDTYCNNDNTTNDISCTTESASDNTADSTTSEKDSTSVQDNLYISYPSDLISEVNRYRAEYGLPILSESSQLDSAAGVRCRELITSMSHTRPDGRSCSSIYAEIGIYPSSWGENLAAGYCYSQSVAADWMCSDGHRANILNPAFAKCGVAYISCQSGYGTYWVILFSD